MPPAADMLPPLRVAVTGAAGQIPAGHTARYRDAAGDQGAAWRGYGAGGLCVPAAARRAGDRPGGEGFRRREPGGVGGRAPARPGHGAARSAVGQRTDIRRAGTRTEPCRSARCAGAGGGQPGQHQRAGGRCQRARPLGGAVHRHDAPGPEPRGEPTGAQATMRRHRHRTRHHLGQPLQHPVPGLVARAGARRVGAPAHRRRVVSERVYSARAEARRGGDRGAWRQLGGLGGERGHRPPARSVAGLGRTLAVDVGAERRLVRRRRRTVVLGAVCVPGWTLSAGAGPADR
eukprot:ctg_4504.g451